VTLSYLNTALLAAKPKKYRYKCPQGSVDLFPPMVAFTLNEIINKIIQSDVSATPKLTIDENNIKNYTFR
jgi:hypothetical protein